MSGSKAQDQGKFVVRLPTGMRERIQNAADRNRRSMNAEIADALLDKYPAPVPKTPKIKQLEYSFG